jgi:hypothetical protein
MQYRCCVYSSAPADDQTIEARDGSSEGGLRLGFSNGDHMTVSRDDGPEGFTIHQVGQPLIIG